MNNAVRLLLLALLLGLAGCGGQQAGEPPLAGARIGGPLSLTDQTGRRVTDATFAGRYRIVYFGYTFCPDVCPTTLQKLMQAYQAFAKQAPERAARIQPIFVTVDPARDTPTVLRQYVAAFDPRLIGLTGSEAEIAEVARAFAVSYRRVAAEGSSDYLMDHASMPILFGPRGEPIALLTTDQTTEALVAELDKWVR